MKDDDGREDGKANTIEGFSIGAMCMSESIIGIMMLDTNFYRPKGDIGNPKTFPFPVDYQIVEGATPVKAVTLGDPSLIQPFIHHAKALENRGVKAITTSCGFLSLFQREIQSQLKIPFFSSSLMQIPLVESLSGGKVGIITARKSSLTNAHFRHIGIAHMPGIIAGMDQMPAFTSAIIEESKALDMEAVSLELKEVTNRLLNNNPDIRSIVLECTNLPPYRDAMREVTDLPIFDMTTLMTYVAKSVL